MAEHTTTSPEHPVEAFLSSALTDLHTLADAPTWSMDEATTTRVVDLTARVTAGLAELEARTITHAATLDLPARAQCRDLRRWLQHTTAVTRPIAPIAR